MGEQPLSEAAPDCAVCVAVNPPNEDELFEAMSSAKVKKAEDLPLLVRTGTAC